MAENNQLATYMEATEQFCNAFAKGMQESIVKKSIPLVANGKMDKLSDAQVRQLALHHMFDYVAKQMAEQQERYTKALIENMP